MTNLDSSPVRLEALASAFSEKLHADGLVQDRPQRSKTIAQAFVGSEAVTILLQLLQEEGSSSATRQDALVLGRTMAEQFHYFSHCKSTKKKELLLEDSSSDYYQFQDNLPIEVYKTKKLFPSLWDKIALLEANLIVKSYKTLTKKTHEDCFPAKQAVTCLVELKLVKSRGEAVHLMRKLMAKVKCCKPIEQRKFIDSTHFHDDERLYRFVPMEERVPAPAKKDKPRRNLSRSSTIGSHDHHPHHKHHHLDDSQTTVSASATSHTASMSSSSGSIKDNSYFEQRASGVRERLEHRRRVRVASTNSQAGSQAA